MRLQHVHHLSVPSRDYWNGRLRLGIRWWANGKRPKIPSCTIRPHSPIMGDRYPHEDCSLSFLLSLLSILPSPHPPSILTFFSSGHLPPMSNTLLFAAVGFGILIVALLFCFVSDEDLPSTCVDLLQQKTKAAPQDCT